jgi:hypothetical protein
MPQPKPQMKISADYTKKEFKEFKEFKELQESRSATLFEIDCRH